ncbi:MAG: hypothetical protein V3U31_04310 [Dehalococcoidia bacterium]
MEPGWLKGKQRVGVTAGASTPDEAVAEVIDQLERLCGPPSPLPSNLGPR